MISKQIQHWVSAGTDIDLVARLAGKIRRDGDTDTNASITGAIAGALYGFKAIPKQWVQVLDRKNKWNVWKRRQITVGRLKDVIATLAQCCKRGSASLAGLSETLRVSYEGEAPLLRVVPRADGGRKAPEEVRTLGPSRKPEGFLRRRCKASPSSAD